MITLAPVECCHCNDADVHIYPIDTEGVECHNTTCKTVFHARCCTMAARRVGLLCDQTNTAHMFCEAHFKDLREARKRQAIMLKHVQTARSAYLAGNAVPVYDPRAEAVAQTTKASTLTVNPVNVVGMLTQTPLHQLCAACPIDEGGFCQRAVASFAASTIETLIRDNGYDVLAGNFAIQELPYTEEELRELQSEDLLPNDFVPPPLLSSMRPANVPAGGWAIDATDPIFRIKDRRFVIIDGNNRIVALVNLTSENPDFLKDVSLNTYLVELNLFNPVEVLCASMKCNKLSHAHIANNIFDTIQ